MNDREREQVRQGIEALNAALAGLGYPPVGENPDVRMADPVVLDFPTVVVDKPGVAPLRFVFGPIVDLWIGPFYELLDIPVDSPVSAQTRGLIVDEITLVLRSEVLCRRRWLSNEVILRQPGQEPWRTLRSFGGDRETGLEPRYEPYAREPPSTDRGQGSGELPT